MNLSLTGVRLAFARVRRGLLIFTLAFGFGASAQGNPGEDKEHSDWKIGVMGGPFLPSNNPGVNEVMKAFGGSIMYFDHIFGVEIAGIHSAENGAVVTYVLPSLLFGMKIPAIDDVTLFLGIGPHMSYNRAAPIDNIEQQYGRRGGFHTNADILVKLGGSWSFRGGSMIINGPGRALFVDVGFVYSFGSVVAEDDVSSKPN